MTETIKSILENIVAIFFAFSWGYYAIQINNLKEEIKELKKKKQD